MLKTFEDKCGPLFKDIVNQLVQTFIINLATPLLEIRFSYIYNMCVCLYCGPTFMDRGLCVFVLWTHLYGSGIVCVCIVDPPSWTGDCVCLYCGPTFMDQGLCVSLMDPPLWIGDCVYCGPTFMDRGLRRLKSRSKCGLCRQYTTVSWEHTAVAWYTSNPRTNSMAPEPINRNMNVSYSVGNWREVCLQWKWCPS